MQLNMFMQDMEEQSLKSAWDTYESRGRKLIKESKIKSMASGGKSFARKTNKSAASCIDEECKMSITERLIESSKEKCKIKCHE